MHSIAADVPADTAVPHCCNVGVIFRTLIAVNGIVLAVLMLQADSWRAASMRFVEISADIELACMASLLALCGLRRVLCRTPRWMQLTACAAVPAAVTVLAIVFLRTYGLSSANPAHYGAAAAVCGIALQHYLELRTRAFSPALAEARLQALQARIRPHFLFNSLNAVLSLIRTEPRRAEEALEDLADLFRVLMRDGRDIVSLADEIRLCKQYLAIEKIRLGERLQVEWDLSGIDENAAAGARVPALLLQPLLENAVRYGIEPAREKAMIRVRVARSIDRVDILVVNPLHMDIAPAMHAQGNHMALENIRERLALLYDMEAQLTATRADRFFEVRLQLPYTKASS